MWYTCQPTAMMSICVAMAAKNLEPKNSAKSRFLKTAYPPGALLSLKGRYRSARVSKSPRDIQRADLDLEESFRPRALHIACEHMIARQILTVAKVQI